MHCIKCIRGVEREKEDKSSQVSASLCWLAFGNAINSFLREGSITSRIVFELLSNCMNESISISVCSPWLDTHLFKAVMAVIARAIVSSFIAAAVIRNGDALFSCWLASSIEIKGITGVWLSVLSPALQNAAESLHPYPKEKILSHVLKYIGIKKKHLEKRIYLGSDGTRLRITASVLSSPAATCQLESMVNCY